MREKCVFVKGMDEEKSLSYLYRDMTVEELLNKFDLSKRPQIRRIGVFREIKSGHLIKEGEVILLNQNANILSIIPQQFASAGPSQFKYHLDVPSKFRDNQKIINDPAWQLFISLKEEAYPKLSIREFWSLLGLDKSYTKTLASHIVEHIKKGTQFSPSKETLGKINDIIRKDVSLNKAVNASIRKKIYNLLPESKSMLTKRWIGWKENKQKIWKLIYEYLKENPEIKQLTDYKELQENLINYLKIFDDVHIILSEDAKKLEMIKKAVIAIHLLRQDNPPSQITIKKESKFSGNQFIKEIRDCLKIPLPHSSANLDLFRDPKKKIKECSQCHEIKSYGEFKKRKKGFLRSECRSCTQTTQNIHLYEKKLLLAIFLTLKSQGKTDDKKFLKHVKQGKRFNVKIMCSDCDNDLTNILPVIDFHHKDPSKKSDTFGGGLKSLSISKMIRKAEKEDLEVYCANCHRMFEASKFRRYSDIISRVKSPNEVRITLEEGRTTVRQSVAKRIVIKELYNGTCSNCKEVTTDMLPAQSFHHTDPVIKTISPTEYINRYVYDINKIKQKFREEKITLLCENCHRLEESYIFKIYKDRIYRKYLDR